MLLLVLLPLAFFVHLGVRVAFGEAGFWLNGYTEYYDLPADVVTGKGFYFDTTCAYWPPLYPAFVALTALGGKPFLLIVIPQALMGASTPLLASLTGREIFNPVTRHHCPASSPPSIPIKSCTTRRYRRPAC